MSSRRFRTLADLFSASPPLLTRLDLSLPDGDAELLAVRSTCGGTLGDYL